MDVLSFVYDMTLGARSVWSDPVKKVKAVLDGGLYPVLANVLFQLPPAGNDYGIYLHFLVELGLYAAYRGILPSLEKAILLVQSSPGPFSDARSGACWKLIVQWAKERRAMTGMAPVSHTTPCHCIQVRQAFSTIEEISPLNRLFLSTRTAPSTRRPSLGVVPGVVSWHTALVPAKSWTGLPAIDTNAPQSPLTGHQSIPLYPSTFRLISQLSSGISSATMADF